MEQAAAPANDHAPCIAIGAAIFGFRMSRVTSACFAGTYRRDKGVVLFEAVGSAHTRIG
jgi:hypothetical protein